MPEVFTQQDIADLLELVATETIEEFNIAYGAERELDEEKIEYLLAFGIITLFGYAVLSQRNDIRGDIRKRVLDQFPKEYKGISETTRREFENLRNKLGRQPLAQDLEEFRRKRMKAITDGLYYTTRNELEFMLADEEGLPFVGAISVGDERVRDQHVINDGKYWKASRYQPWHDPNCRCQYIHFTTRYQAERAGFTPLKHIPI